MKICIVGAELLHTDGQTEMTKLTVAFCNIFNAPNKAADERCRETEKTRFTLNNSVTENCATYVEQCGRAGQATGKIRFPCWITKATVQAHILNI